MRLAASALSAARPLAPYLRIATQLPSPPTQPQARPRTAAALRPHGLQPSIDRKHGPAAIQPMTPGRGWRPAACTATPALRPCAGARAAPAGAVIVLPMPRPLTGCRAEGCRITAMGARWVLGSAHRPALYLRPAPRQGQAAARALCCLGPPQRWPHAARPALPPARLGGCSGREGNDW